jgi:hypothetical protein
MQHNDYQQAIFWTGHIFVTTKIPDIIHRPVFYLKHDVSESGLYLHLQVEIT